jgi:hypothetical protein
VHVTKKTVQRLPTVCSLISASGCLAVPVILHPLKTPPTCEKVAAWDSEMAMQFGAPLHIPAGVKGSMKQELFHTTMVHFANVIRQRLNDDNQWALILLDGVEVHFWLSTFKHLFLRHILLLHRSR